jgi:P27 family predicted phage terminase small subunit
MKGRKPKPTELKLLTGNPGKRSLPKPVDVGPIGRAPAGMSEAAREKWVESADEFGLWLKRSDRSALMIYCETWAEMLNALKNVEREGSMVLTPNGLVQKSPWMTKVEHCRVELRKWLVEFHGTPTARARVADAGQGAEVNPFAALG